MKRRLAVEWNAEGMMEGNRKTYFWTFTTLEEETPQEMAGMWDGLLKELRRKFGAFDFIRVVEPHKSGTRFHYHVLINVFLDVRHVREIAQHFGWGRIHAVIVRDKGAASYLAKYLSKAKRCEALVGVRLFSISLRPKSFQKNLIRDIEYRENGKTCQELYGPMLARLPRWQRWMEARILMDRAQSEQINLRNWLLVECGDLREAGFDVEAEYVRDLVDYPEGRLEYVRNS